MGYYFFDLQEFDIDFIICVVYKFYGLKGIGFLYVNKKIKFFNLIQGGFQECGYCGGIENLVGIVGLVKVMDLVYEDVYGYQQYVQGFKDYMIVELKKEFFDVIFYGEIDLEKSFYIVLNVCLLVILKVGMLLFIFDLKGVVCLGGSVCIFGVIKGLYVFEGIGGDMLCLNVCFFFFCYMMKVEIDFVFE